MIDNKKIGGVLPQQIEHMKGQTSLTIQKTFSDRVTEITAEQRDAIMRRHAALETGGGFGKGEL